MGQEAKCRVRLGKTIAEGRALLESKELIFRGPDLRLNVPFAEMNSLEAVDGWLRFKFSQGAAAFELGAQAAKWADTIRNPKSLVDKLGVKPAMLVSVLGIGDADFRRQLDATTADVTDRAAKESDIIFLAADQPQTLEQLRDLSRAIKRNGAIWVVYPKGQKHITEGAVFAAGKRAGLVDVKVASFSATHTALKFVIPVNKR